MVLKSTLFGILSFFLIAEAYSQQKLGVEVLDNPIVIDGVLESEWDKAGLVTDFTQLEPNKGVASTRKTEVRVARHDDNLYFSFVCYKEQGEQIVARIQRRDQLQFSDDVVTVLLDTYFDKRTSLMFVVNALGTLTDAKITDDGKNVDLLWDAEWEAKTSITDTYWVVEIRIPYKSIQYNPKSSKWNVNFGRVIRSNQETAWWMPVTENFRISQGGRLEGVLVEKMKKHSLNVFPYATARYENSDITGANNKFKGDVGIDLRYQYSSNLIANLTVNPDFATVEGDKEQINLTPWELRFPDKRLFFQDGNEMFSTRINTFYSRRIGDMKYGGKMIGKAGKYQYNALFARTKKNIGNNDPEAWHNAVRVKRDILESSIVGLTYADKMTDTTSYRSLSLDYVLNLGKTWKLTGQFVGSSPGDFLSHSAWYVRFARENNIYHYHLRYTSIGANFKDNVNETGFIQDDDRHELDSDVSHRFWIDKNVKYLDLEGKNNIFWSQKGILRSWYLTYGSRIYLKNKLSFDLYYNNEYKLLDKDYNNNFYSAEFGYNTDEASFVNAGYIKGHNFDRDFRLWEFEFRVQLFKKLSVNYELNNIKYTPDPTSESTTINVVGLDYFFNKDLWVRIFMQNNSAFEKYYFYGLFGWRFKPPFGAVYLIFNSDKFYNRSTLGYMNSEIVFLKVTYPLSIF